MKALDLGELSVALTADTTGIDAAERKFKNAANDMDRDAQKLQRGLEGKLAPAFKKVATAAGALGGVAVAAGGAWLTKQIVDMQEAAYQADVYSQALGVNVEAFSQWTYAAKTVGIQADKVGDIFKDVSDKLGDAFANQGGEAYEVIENLGLSAERLANMKPDQAILEMAGAMEGLNNATKVQMFESIADDTSLLIPLLDDNAERFRELAGEADKYGYTLSDNTVKQSREMREAARELDGELHRLARSLNDTLTPAMAELAGFAADVVEFWTRSDLEELDAQIRQIENKIQMMAGKDETAYDWLGKTLGFDPDSQAERLKVLNELEAKLEKLKEKRQQLIWDGDPNDARTDPDGRPATNRSPTTGSSSSSSSGTSTVGGSSDEPELTAYEKELKSYAETLTRAEAAEESLLEKHAMLDKAYQSEDIGPAVYAREKEKLDRQMAASHEETMKDMGNASEEAAKRIEGALADNLTMAFRGQMDQMEDYFKATLERMAAEAAASQIVQWLDIGGGSGGGGATAGVDGGRAIGGPVRAGGMYEITENGEPEVLKSGGKDYLLMGNRSGHVSPVSGVGGASGSSAPPRVEIHTHGETGDLKDVETTQGEDGSTRVDLFFDDQVKRSIQSGKMDRVLRERFPMLRSEGRG